MLRVFATDVMGTVFVAIPARGIGWLFLLALLLNTAMARDYYTCTWLCRWGWNDRLLLLDLLDSSRCNYWAVSTSIAVYVDLINITSNVFGTLLVYGTAVNLPLDITVVMCLTMDALYFVT